jgi:hypothetical protein
MDDIRDNIIVAEEALSRDVPRDNANSEDYDDITIVSERNKESESGICEASDEDLLLALRGAVVLSLSALLQFAQNRDCADQPLEVIDVLNETLRSDVNLPTNIV